jgi:SAM-dependent methyltransferase
VSRSSFDVVAREYEAGRPGYPHQVFESIEDLAGTFFDGAKVADIGAGTGKATRAMAERGADVVAVDHGRQMLDVLRANNPEVTVVLADANALPFVDASFDLVTFAQSWHWVDFDRASAEVARVLRPGGALAVWWNTSDPQAEPWLVAHRSRLESLENNDVDLRFDGAWQAIPYTFASFDVETVRIRWQRYVSREVILDEMRSKSYVIALGEADRRELVDRERTLLPDGELCEAFATRLAVVRFPPARP